MSQSPLSTEVPKSFKIGLAWVIGVAVVLIVLSKFCSAYQNAVVNDRDALVAIQRMEDDNLSDEVTPEIKNLTSSNKDRLTGGDPYKVKYQYVVNEKVHTAICTKGFNAPLMCTPYIPLGQ